MVDASTRRADDPDERYRLYIDESGDHVFRHLDEPAHRYLCLVGCWFRGHDYREFHAALDRFKQRHLTHHPDDPPILHREDIVRGRKRFWPLRDPAKRDAFDHDLRQLIDEANFRLVGIVIDKYSLTHRYYTPDHPYHLALAFLLERYCGYLNHVNRVGDVLAETRGGREDRLLKEEYRSVYRAGTWVKPASFFKRALTSGELKMKPKSANIAGLQLADLLAHPTRLIILAEAGRVAGPLPPFTASLAPILERKFDRHRDENQIAGYGKVLFPK